MNECGSIPLGASLHCDPSHPAARQHRVRLSALLCSRFVRQHRELNPVTNGAFFHRKAVTRFVSKLPVFAVLRCVGESSKTITITKRESEIEDRTSRLYAGERESAKNVQLLEHCVNRISGFCRRVERADYWITIVFETPCRFYVYSPFG